jgi:hypothetical protein
MKTYGGVEAFLTSAPDGYEWSASCGSRFEAKERYPGTNRLGIWACSRTILDAVDKTQISLSAPIRTRFLGRLVSGLISVVSDLSRVLRHTFFL